MEITYNTKILRFKIISNKLNGRERCIVCEARHYCGLGHFKCECGIFQHYINIQRERKAKLEKLKNKF